MEKRLIPLNLGFFGEEGQDVTPAETPAEDGMGGEGQAPQAVDYDARLKEDKDLQSFLDKRLAAASKKQEAAVREAVEKERRRQQQLAEAKLNDAERKKLMTPEERAEAAERKAQELEERIARQDEVRQFTGEINDILAESKIPSELFNAGIDYHKMPHDEIRERALVFSKYEYFPKGEFAKKVEEQATLKFNNATKQKQPESGTQTAQAPAKGLALVPLESY